MNNSTNNLKKTNYLLKKTNNFTKEKGVIEKRVVYQTTLSILKEHHSKETKQESVCLTSTYIILQQINNINFLVGIFFYEKFFLYLLIFIIKEQL